MRGDAQIAFATILSADMVQRGGEQVPNTTVTITSTTQGCDVELEMVVGDIGPVSEALAEAGITLNEGTDLEGLWIEFSLADIDIARAVEKVLELLDELLDLEFAQYFCKLTESSATPELVVLAMDMYEESWYMLVLSNTEGVDGDNTPLTFDEWTLYAHTLESDDTPEGALLRRARLEVRSVKHQGIDANVPMTCDLTAVLSALAKLYP